MEIPIEEAEEVSSETEEETGGGFHVENGFIKKRGRLSIRLNTCTKCGLLKKPEELKRRYSNEPYTVCKDEKACEAWIPGKG